MTGRRDDHRAGSHHRHADQSDTINGLMHESVNPNNPNQFTRPEFAGKRFGPTFKPTVAY